MVAKRRAKESLEALVSRGIKAVGTMPALTSSGEKKKAFEPICNTILDYYVC